MELLLLGVTKILKLIYSCVTNILNGWVLITPVGMNAISIKLFFLKREGRWSWQSLSLKIFKVLSYIISLKSNKSLCIYQKVVWPSLFLKSTPWHSLQSTEYISYQCSFLFQSLGWEDPLEEGMTTHSSIVAWRIPMDRGAWWATKSQTWLSD